MSGAQYVQKLQEVLAEGSLEASLALCSKAFEQFKTRIAPTLNLEDFLQTLQIEEEFAAHHKDTYTWLNSLQ